eukprot:546870_1
MSVYGLPFNGEKDSRAVRHKLEGIDDDGKNNATKYNHEVDSKSCTELLNQAKKPGRTVSIKGRSKSGLTAAELNSLNEKEIENSLEISEARQYVTDEIIENRKLAHKLCVEYFEVEGKKRLSNQLKSKNIINTDDELDIMDTHALHWFEVCCMLHEEVMEDFYMHCINVPNDEKLKLNPLFKIIQMFPPRKARNIYVQRNRLKMKEKEAQNEVHIEEKTKEKQPTIFSLWGVNRNNSNNNNVNTKRKIMIKFEDKKYEIEYGRADTLLDVKNTFFDHYIEEELNKKEYVFGCLEYGVFQINECIKLWSVSHYKTIECSKRLLKLIVHEFNDENTSVGNRTIWISLLSDLDELTKHLQRGKKGFRYKGQELYAEINPNAQDEDIEIETDLSLTEQGIMDNTKIYFFTD